MLTIKVKGNEYKLKFGYKSFKKSGILKEVIAMRRKAKGIEDTEEELDPMEEAEKESDSMEEAEMLEEILELNSKLVLAALQKNHKEFRVDYKNPDSVNEVIDKVDDLMDDYMDEEDSMSIMDLFTTLTEELFDDGFLSKKSAVLETAMENQDATITPTDHRQSEN